MTKWLVSALAIAAPPIILLACATERAVDPKQPPSFGGQAPMACNWPGGTPGNPEEEVFGDIVSSSTNWDVSITRGDDEDSENNQADYLDVNAIVNFLHPCTAGGHANHLAEWGWYGFGFGPQCEDPDAQTANEYERHRTANGQFITEEREPHCVNAGHFTLTITQADLITIVRPIDFLGYTMIPGVLNLAIANEAVTGPGSLDVKVNVKDQASLGVPPAGVEVSATENRNDTLWTSLQPGVFHIPSNFYARFRASNSGPQNGFSNADYLVRYFWNWTVDATDRTGFTNAASEGKFPVRARQFPLGTRTVLAHLVDPDDRHTPPWDIEATNYGRTELLTFDVYGPLSATISPSAPTVMVQNSLQFTGGGSNGTGTNTYQWDFGDGESSPLLNPSHTYQQQGSRQVEFRKTDAYNTASAKVTVNVTDPPPTGLTASNVTATGALIGWTSINSAPTTTVERRVSGTSTWGPGGTASPDVDTLTLTGLASCTTYDVKARHVATETTALALFHTPAPGSAACAPLNFALVNCYTQVIGGKTYRMFNVTWTQTQFSFKSRSQIGEATTNNPAMAVIIQDGLNPFTNATIAIPITSGINRYYWVRHTLINGTGPSSWVALPDNPLQGTQAC